MAATFNCPTCGAPLDYSGSGDSMHCPYCNSSVIVPVELKHPANSESLDTTGFSLLMEQAGQFKELASLARSGQKIEAIKRYRALTGCGLVEAKTAVENITAGNMVQIDRSVIQSQNQNNPGDLSQLSFQPGTMAEMMRLAEVGQKIEAIKLYRKITGSDLITAKAAVEKIATGGQGESVPKGSCVGKGIGVLITALITISIMVGISAAVFALLPKSIQESAGDLIGRFSAGPGYVELRINKQGSGAGFFGNVHQIAVDTSSNIYVGDYEGGRVQVFDAKGNFKFLWQIEKPKSHIQGLEVDQNGIVYALFDSNVYRYNAATGKPGGKMTFGMRLADGEDFSSIREIGMTPDGNLILNNGRDIALVKSDGDPLQILYKPLQNVSENSGPDLSMAADKNGNLYALDRQYGFVYKFSAGGEYITRFGGAGDASGQFYFPESISIDPNGRVFVGDSGRIQIFNGDGQFQGKLDMDSGGVPGQLRFDGQNHLIVLLNYGKEILRYVLN